MTEEERAVAIVSGFSIQKITNTVALLEQIIGTHGMRHADKLAHMFCRKHNLPRMDTMDMMRVMGKAANRKMLMADPDLDTNSQPTIIH